MRILFVSNLYPPYELGGMEQLCQETCDGLTARGHTCHVLTSRFRVPRGAAPEPGITRALHLQADVYHYRPLDFFLRRPSQERANRRALRAAIDSFRPDIVFVWGMWNLSLSLAYWAERWMPGRVAYAVAGYWFLPPNVHEAYWQAPAKRAWVEALKTLARWLANRILARERRAHPLALEQVACVSEFVRTKLAEAGVLPNGARVIYNGIDPAPFLDASAARQARADALRLVYVGGVAQHKGVHTAVEALGLLQQRGQAGGLSLTVVGGGHPDYQAGLMRRVAALGLEQQVAFIGRVPRDQIARILAEHDVFLFTSVWEEPIARTVMEAMASGLAVIGTAVGGQREMFVHRENALVFPPGDAAALAETIIQLKASPALVHDIAQAGLRTVLERFTLDRMIDETEAWLQEITL